MRPREAAALLLEVARVARVLPRVERDRRTLGPLPAVDAARARSRGAPARSSAERALLRRAVAAADARLPGGANCLRRALLEISLDAGAASEPLHLYLTADGTPGSGHARLASWPEDGRTFEAHFVI